jgi:hypothetical protein
MAAADPDRTGIFRHPGGSTIEYAVVTLEAVIRPPK